MRKTLIIPIVFLLFSCQSTGIDKFSVIDYLVMHNESREFQSVNNSSMLDLTINQIAEQINDTLWEFEFNWVRSDLFPINKSIEKYSSNNYYEIVAQSYYELNADKKPLEIHAEIIGGRTFNLSSKNCIYDIRYNFQTDKYLTMIIHSENTINLEKIDTLSKNSVFLVFSSKDRILLDYSDNRNDSTFFIENKRVYEKGNGLILFIQKNGSDTIIYRMKN